MKIIKFKSFEEWEFEVLRLMNELKRKKEDSDRTFSNILFRGHSCESWQLKTTIERYINKKISVEEYHRYLRLILPAFISYTGKKFNLEYNPNLGDFLGPPPGYEFMSYLRHQGFPTPLLDWTRSPYIAAFFGFKNAGSEKNVAIFTYIEYMGRGKAGRVGESTICNCGPYLITHKRHFNQQGEYTVCREKIDGNWYYCNHEEAFVLNNEKQDILTKYLIPASEKNNVLNKLDLMNINDFSLFNNEEGLASMLAFKEIMKRNY